MPSSTVSAGQRVHLRSSAEPASPPLWSSSGRRRSEPRTERGRRARSRRGAARVVRVARRGSAPARTSSARRGRRSARTAPIRCPRRTPRATRAAARSRPSRRSRARRRRWSALPGQVADDDARRHAERACHERERRREVDAVALAHLEELRDRLGARSVEALLDGRVERVVGTRRRGTSAGARRARRSRSCVPAVTSAASSPTMRRDVRRAIDVVPSRWSAPPAGCARICSSVGRGTLVDDLVVWPWVRRRLSEHGAVVRSGRPRAVEPGDVDRRVRHRQPRRREVDAPRPW